MSPLICVVCGSEYTRPGKRGPVSQRCAECLASDRRVDRKPIREQVDRACVRCGVSGLGVGVSRKYCGKCRREVQTEAQVRWGRANRDKICAAQQRHKAKFPEKYRSRYSRFGVLEIEFQEKLAAQGGVCAICGSADPGDIRGFNFDHDHARDKKDPAGHRGVLCRSCNLLLGYAKDSPTILKKSVAYLKKWGRA